ncbi:MAG: nicotinate-nucleotide--dimethylbenzimidazole phosphoribosyltransferase [Pseudomonadales bacterium]|nr:nicotinate-nucleotide--dimethylbenzimidazole phosphoribosyltransferase [Pseudomonadales bacterium]
MNENLPVHSSDPVDWFNEPALPLDCEVAERARQRQQNLTKPPGSLGLLEELAIQFAAWQSSERPQIKRIQIVVFAGDHGIAREGVSAFPQQVTVEMIRNFSRGGAAISVLADQHDADFKVINMGTATPCEELPRVVNVQLAAGTKNFVSEPAMTRELCLSALQAGMQQIESSADIFIGGEMGIGNTSSATALVCALLNAEAKEFVGRGTGLDDSGLLKKQKLIQQALDRHQPDHSSPLECLRLFGGLEIAALAGAYIRCAQLGVPILVDGFITSAAALVAIKINQSCKHWMIFSHQSAESGHAKLLEAMGVEALLDLQLRLGEGSGAALALPIVQSACKIQSGMATFDQAEVSR